MSDIETVTYRIWMWSEAKKRWIRFIRAVNTTDEANKIYDFCFAMKDVGHEVKLERVD